MFGRCGVGVEYKSNFLNCIVSLYFYWCSFLNSINSWGSRIGSLIVYVSPKIAKFGFSKLLCEQQNQWILISPGFAFFAFLRPNWMTNRWILSAFPSVKMPSCVSTHCSPTDFQELVQGYSFLLGIFQDEFQIAQQSQKLFKGGIDG